MSAFIEGIIESITSQNETVYRVTPCPQFGMTAKTCSRIDNPESDPIWHQIKKYASDYMQPATVRLNIELKEEFQGILYGCHIKSIKVLETR